MLKKISVEIIADSINPNDHRITTYKLVYPRYIHAEVMTHRTFSRNSASSRAVPIERFMAQVAVEPVIPVRWGLNGKGMQDHGEITGRDASHIESLWREAANCAVSYAGLLAKSGLHKQLANRLIEPYLWMETLVTATQWENFFALRVHKDAHPDFQRLAYLMLEAYVEKSTPNAVPWGRWHIPFGDRMPEGLELGTQLKVAVARAARLSYMTMDGKIDVDKDVELHDRLAQSGHWSPFEHVAQCRYGQFGNFIGWEQYRRQFPGENRKCDLRKLLHDYRESLQNDRALSGG